MDVHGLVWIGRRRCGREPVIYNLMVGRVGGLEVDIA
jgi:hypothetical protein